MNLAGYWPQREGTESPEGASPPPSSSGSPLPRLECAWCNKVLREGPEPISHGMCSECEAEWS